MTEVEEKTTLEALGFTPPEFKHGFDGDEDPRPKPPEGWRELRDGEKVEKGDVWVGFCSHACRAEDDIGSTWKRDNISATYRRENYRNRPKTEPKNGVPKPYRDWELCQNPHAHAERFFDNYIFRATDDPSQDWYCSYNPSVLQPDGTWQPETAFMWYAYTEEGYEKFSQGYYNGTGDPSNSTHDLILIGDHRRAITELYEKACKEGPIDICYGRIIGYFRLKAKTCRSANP